MSENSQGTGEQEIQGCGLNDVEKQLHEVHQKEEEELHKQHIAEEQSLHKAHEEEERELHEGLKKEPDRIFIKVCVLTISGRFPDEGFDTVGIDTKPRNELKRAIEALRLVGTDDWITRADSREIDPDKSYAENGLECEVKIDFGAREGGGG